MAGFVCEVLNCANYAKGCELDNDQELATNLDLINCTCLQSDLQWIGVIKNRLVGVSFELSRQHTKLHAIASNLWVWLVIHMVAHKLVRWKCVLQQNQAAKNQ